MDATGRFMTGAVVLDGLEVGEDAELDLDLDTADGSSGIVSAASAMAVMAREQTGFGSSRYTSSRGSAASAVPPSLRSASVAAVLRNSTVLRGPWAVFHCAVIDPTPLADIKRELTLRPHSMGGGVRKYLPPVECFETRGRGGTSEILLVPRAYFVARFGVPAVDDTALGAPVRDEVRFEGALRDDRQRGFVDKLVDTLLVKRHTIALGSAEPGCGKTVMFLHLWANILRRKCLVIVHGLPIVAQWIAAVRKFVPAARVGIIHQDLWQVRGRDIVVASSDTLASRAPRYTSALWREFGVVCFDEAHHIMASTFMSIYRSCMHARYCLSLTGTPYRKDGLTAAMPFLTGPNAAFMKNTDPVHIRAVHFHAGRQEYVPHRWGPGKGKPNEAAMISALVEDEPRTRLLADMVRASVVAGRRVLVLCARNDLRRAVLQLVTESLADLPCPHKTRRLVICEGANVAATAGELGGVRAGRAEGKSHTGSSAIHPSESPPATPITLGAEPDEMHAEEVEEEQEALMEEQARAAVVLSGDVSIPPSLKRPRDEEEENAGQCCESSGAGAGSGGGQREETKGGSAETTTPSTLTPAQQRAMVKAEQARAREQLRAEKKRAKDLKDRAKELQARAKEQARLERERKALEAARVRERKAAEAARVKAERARVKAEYERAKEMAKAERGEKALVELYDTLYVSSFLAVGHQLSPEARAAMEAKVRELEAIIPEARCEAMRNCEGVVPRVVPELREQKSEELREQDSGDDSEVAASWVEELVAGEDYLTRMNKQRARAILATYVMAREALDIPGLDTLILGTPSSDVRQAVGRVRRKGLVDGSLPAPPMLGSVLRTPKSLVIDLIDEFTPFVEWSNTRARYYYDENFSISRVHIYKAGDAWDAVGKALVRNIAMRNAIRDHGDD